MDPRAYSVRLFRDILEAVHQNSSHPLLGHPDLASTRIFFVGFEFARSIQEAAASHAKDFLEEFLDPDNGVQLYSDMVRALELPSEVQLSLRSNRGKRAAKKGLSSTIQRKPHPPSDVICMARSVDLGFHNVGSYRGS